MLDYLIAAAYVRVSTDDQTEYSPDAQLKALKKYAADHNMIIPPEHIYMDEGISGRKAEKRPAFMQMIATAKSKDRPFDVILVHKFDRFARNREDSIVFKNLLKKDCNVNVISITESIDDNGSGMGMLIEAISEAYAEFYSINLSKEVKKGMTEKALRGGLQCIASFGYKIVNHKLEPEPTEAELVKEMFSRFLAGDGLVAIAKSLNNRSITTHRGTKFENRTVEYILRNPVYIGKLRWNPTGRTRRDFDNPNIILADSEHEPIIDIDTWNKTQERIAQVKAQWKYKQRPQSEHKDWISGLVRCVSCGATLVFSAPHYYKCNHYLRGRCTTSQHIRADLLKAAIIEQLKKDASSSVELNINIIEIGTSQNKVNTITAEIHKLEQKKERLRDAYLNGADTIDEYKAFKQNIDNEIAGAQKRLESEKKAVSARDTQGIMRNSLIDAISTLESPTATIADKHNAIKSVVESCMFDKAKNQLTMVYRLIFAD